MNSIKSLLVFCGASLGRQECYTKAAFATGAFLAQQGIRLVYGGAKVGLMGAVADGALRMGGKVTGVIPRFLQNKELAHEGLTDLICVDSMHERKLQMYTLSDAAIALPGGFGTLEEFFELLTWSQLGLHQKPMGLLNINSFFQPLLDMCRTMEGEGFLTNAHHQMVLHHPEIDKLLDLLLHYETPPAPKWLSSSEV